MSKLNLGNKARYYLSYWRLFILSVVLCVAGSFLYIYISTPMYEASASLLIKPDNKPEETKNAPTLNLFAGKKILENEIEVLRSRTVLSEVVKNLKLYAPVFRKNKIGAASAYTLSPVLVELRDPDALVEHDNEKIYYKYDFRTKQVIIDSIPIPLDTWVNFGRGDVKFVYNPSYTYQDRNGPFFFSFVHVQKIADELLTRLDIQVPNKLATILDLKLLDEVPKRGSDILNEIMKVYDSVDIGDKTNLAKNALQFLDERIALVEDELHSIESNLQQFRSKKGVVDISEQGKLYLGNVGKNDQDLGEINIQLAILGQLDEYINGGSQNSKVIPSMVGLNDPQLSQLVEKLYSREAEFSRLKGSVGENNPIAVSFRNEIDKIKANIKESISGHKQNLMVSKANLSQTGGQYSSSLKSIPQKERELLEISRQQSVKNTIYTFLLQRREEAALSRASTVPDSRIVDFAQTAMVPAKPKKSLIYLCAFFFGVGVVGMWLYAKNLFHPVISTKDDILENSAIPLIGEVAHIKKIKNASSPYESNGVSNEQFRKIRTSLSCFQLEAEKQRILIASSQASEGKLFIATQLARSLAALNKKVMIINLDLNNPGLDTNFDVQNYPGLYDYLAGTTEICRIIQSSKIDRNIFIISSGDHVNNPIDLFSEGKFSRLLNKLQTEYDNILIISAPLDASSDAYLISKWCTSTLFIVRQGYTPLKAIRNINASSGILKFENAVLLLNDSKNSRLIE